MALPEPQPEPLGEPLSVAEADLVAVLHREMLPVAEADTEPEAERERCRLEEPVAQGEKLKVEVALRV